jgi:tetratricopeptide (TPR) repeat protein/nitrate/TMAO reductase-like tetraheme cytochrome c subunit
MSRLGHWPRWLFLALAANSLYLLSAASPQPFYLANVLAHLGLGLLLLLSLFWLLRSAEWRRRLAWAAPFLLVCAALGVFLVWKGALTRNHWALVAHVIAGFAGAALVCAALRWRALAVVLAGGGALCGLALAWQSLFPPASHRIRNPLVVPTSMAEEGGGPASPFWPSAANTNVRTTIPSNFFLDSARCGDCHQEIYEQWRGSMHHFSSFNNQFYRKSIEHMQEIAGTQSSKWCAGCHDHAMIFSGQFEKPAAGQIDTPEAQAGLGCVSCHSIVHVDSTMGNGGFTIEYPPLHGLATSRDKYLRLLHDFLVHVDPEPHRRAFMKPFMRQQSSEFCSTCHKVHLDVPVNNYRWLRGFNDYDNWQASGVSGQGARSFYYPETPMTCADCHMPLVPARDPAARHGMVRSHRFAAANTAVPFVHGDQTQLKAVEGFLKSGFITVDIFAALPAERAPGIQMLRRTGDSAQRAMSTFAVGEEAEAGGQFFVREMGDVAAPLDRTHTTFQPGSTVKVDVVVRTRKIGHFFPGGTVDAFDVWLELQGRDASGKIVFWSGRVEDEGRGPVEKGAHFYRSFMLDGAGNQIDKRNAWQARSLLYVRLIPPGAADVAHYRVSIPKDAKGPITLTAKLNYRKFSHYYTQFSFAGQPKPGQDSKLVSVHHDGREYDFAAKNIPANAAGLYKDRIPVLPIVTLAQAEARLRLGGARASPSWHQAAARADYERWNDWGIGLLLQGDLKGAEYAFRKVVEANPDYADGWLNIARALIQEGETEAAKEFIAQALKLDSSLARVHFFKAMIEKADGDYDAAARSLRRVIAQYPRDRVALNQLGRILFLKRGYAEAVKTFEQVLAVDPEDVTAHYNLMLCHRGLGDLEKARRAETLFRRFKADESAQNLTARMRAISPEDNNERQPIHEHESVPLP